MTGREAVELAAGLDQGVRSAVMFLLAYEHPDLMAEAISRMTAAADADAAEDGR